MYGNETRRDTDALNETTNEIRQSEHNHIFSSRRLIINKFKTSVLPTSEVRNLQMVC